MASFFGNPIKRFKTKWSVTTPYQKLRLFYEFGLFVENIVQMPVFSTKPIGIIGYSPILSFIMHCVLLFYTIYYYIHVGNSVDCLPSFCVFGFLVSVSIHEIVILINWKGEQRLFKKNFKCFNPIILILKAKHISEFVWRCSQYVKHLRKQIFSPKLLAGKYIVWPVFGPLIFLKLFTLYHPPS